MRLNKIGSAFAGLVLSAVAASPTLSQTQDLKYRCSGEIKSENIDIQLKACTTLIEDNKSDRELLTILFWMRSELWTQKGNEDRALNDLTQSIKINGNNVIVAEALVRRGKMRLRRRDHDGALADYNEAIHIYPNFAAAYHSRGNAWIDRGAFERAMSDYEKAIQINPNDADAYNSRCWARATAGRNLPQALNDCNAALRIKPQDAATLDSRGLVQLKLAAYDKAIADYTAVLTAKANAASALYGRGVAKRRSGDRVGGEADVARARTIQADIAQVYAGYGVQ